MNEDLLRKVQAKIRAEPESLDMGEFCGTVCCIAGHACLISGHRGPRKLAAIRILEIDDEMAARLFFTPGWPKSFRDRYYFARTKTAEAQITCDRIDHFIATEGRE